MFEFFPQIRGRGAVFLKMQRCHEIIAGTLCYVNSVKCHTRLPLIPQTKHTPLLAFLLPSVLNFDYILFPLDPAEGIRASVTSNLQHRASERDGGGRPPRVTPARVCL